MLLIESIIEVLFVLVDILALLQLLGNMPVLLSQLPHLGIQLLLLLLVCKTLSPLLFVLVFQLQELLGHHIASSGILLKHSLELLVLIEEVSLLLFKRVLLLFDLPLQLIVLVFNLSNEISLLPDVQLRQSSSFVQFTQYLSDFLLIEFGLSGFFCIPSLSVFVSVLIVFHCI